MGRKCYIYVLYSRDECIVRYIGVSFNPENRLYHHMYESKKTHTHMYKSRWYNKHDDIGFKVIYSGEEKDCYKLERDLISKYRKSRRLTNTSPGGSRPMLFSERTKEQQSEIIEKIRKKAIGREISKETRKKMSDAQKKLDKTHLLKYTVGKDNGRAKPVLQYDLNGDFVKKWDYVRGAAKELDINKSNIYGCSGGYQKTAGGYIWKYE